MQKRKYYFLSHRIRGTLTIDLLSYYYLENSQSIYATWIGNSLYISK